MLTDIQKVRLEIGDNDLSLPILIDSEYEYFLEKNYGSIANASVDAAKTVLFKISMRTRQDADIFSIHGQQAAVNYIAALKLYLKDPNLNKILSNVTGYVGGVSISDMQANDANPDNNLTPNPSVCFSTPSSITGTFVF